LGAHVFDCMGDLIRRQACKSKTRQGQVLSAAGQGRVVQRVGNPPRKVGQPPGSESLEAVW
jgi:hypothetical protein